MNPRTTITTPTNFANFPAKNTITPRTISMNGFKLMRNEITGLVALELGNGANRYCPAPLGTRAEPAAIREPMIDRILSILVASVERS